MKPYQFIVIFIRIWSMFLAIPSIWQTDSRVDLTDGFKVRKSMQMPGKQS